MSADLAPRRSAASSLQPAAVRSLTTVRSATDRVRFRATAAAAAGTGVALLIAASAATVRDDVFTGTSVGTGADGTRITEDTFAAPRGLAPFLAEPGLRPGFAIAAVLLVLPFLALAVQAVRVGRVVDERRSRRLLLAGATWADVRRLRIARTRAAFVRGGLLAGPVYLVLWLVLGVALPAGSRLLPPLHWVMPLVWLAVVGVLAVAARLLAVLGFRRAERLSWDGAGAGVPSRTFVLLSALSGVALVVAAPALARSEQVFPALLVLTVVLFLLAAGGGAARSAAGVSRRAQPPSPGAPADPVAGRGRSGRRWFARGDSAVHLLADAQRRGSTGAITGTAGVLFVCGLSFGVEAAMVAQVLTERSGGGGYDWSDVAFYVTGAALAAVVGVVGGLVAVAALLLSLTDQLLGNRRAVASVAALGVEPRRLVRVQAACLRRTAVPATVVGTVVAAVPYTFGLVASAADGGWSPYVLLPVVVVVVVALVTTTACDLLARLLAGRVRQAAALENLRVP
ncbi:hypothetical protein AB2L28_20395 [Kineococcus sp. TBRC 1896]|uniref:FtsX-like permease family protein n=1 Tax=Kineococcus mangrovi TaxID=1660183 RepID=A0ABV4I9C6_9ACTN